MLIWFKAKFLTPLFNFLKQGTSPQKLAWSIAIGFVFGIFPVIGLTTLLCFAIALVFRLNVAAMQLVNYIAYPLQILFIVPFFQLGAWIVGKKGEVFSLDALMLAFQSNFFLSLQELGWSILYAIFAWLVIAIPVCFVTYTICFSIFNKFLKEKTQVI